MTTRHKHAFSTHVDAISANCTLWWLWFMTFLLAMFALNLHLGKFLDSFFWSFLCFPVLLGFLLTHSPNDLEECVVIIWLREVLHEVLLVQLGIQRPKSQQFKTTEHLCQWVEHMIYQSLNCMVHPLLIWLIHFFLSTLNEHKLWRGHWYSPNLDTAKTTGHLLLWVVG